MSTARAMSRPYQRRVRGPSWISSGPGEVNIASDAFGSLNLLDLRFFSTSMI